MNTILAIASRVGKTKTAKATAAHLYEVTCPECGELMEAKDGSHLWEKQPHIFCLVTCSACGEDVGLPKCMVADWRAS